MVLIPKPPNYWECCGDNCPHCVWTTYFEELKKYKQIQELEKQNKFWKSNVNKVLKIFNSNHNMVLK